MKSDYIPVPTWEYKLCGKLSEYITGLNEHIYYFTQEIETRIQLNLLHTFPALECHVKYTVYNSV